MTNKKLLALTAAIVLLVPLVVGCNYHIKLANGMVDIGSENPAFRGITAGTTKTVTLEGKDGKETRKSTFGVDTKGQEGAGE
jgi:hypothetical protein